MTRPDVDSRSKHPQELNLGAVFTRPWVVELILDLAGYTSDVDLMSGTALEPAAGDGAFLQSMVRRLVGSARIRDRDIANAGNSIIAFDINPQAVDVARRNVGLALTAEGVALSTARRLARLWVRQGDFLMEAQGLPSLRWVVGNPPYVRIEDMDKVAMAKYRTTWKTMSGRADLYVGFLEAGLEKLEPGGTLSVICADRWMRNTYGTALRAKVQAGFSMRACIVMHGANVFVDSVSAYPAITVIKNEVQGPALVCRARSTFAAPAALKVRKLFAMGPAPASPDPDFTVSWTRSWFLGSGGWPDADPNTLETIAVLESRLPTLEETGARVSVGAATGADDIFITAQTEGTEKDRLLKAVTAKEIGSGAINWLGRYLVNPWADNQLVSLGDSPGMAAYLTRHAAQLKGRHVALRNPAAWWRTIDRIDASVAKAPKLLIPDLKERIFPVFDAGVYYPAHSLYYITSTTWDLEVLGGLLMSDVASTFVEAYSVRMASGYLRVSAQYLRRVRVPNPGDVPTKLANQLRFAFRARDTAGLNSLARIAYQLEGCQPKQSSSIDGPNAIT